VENFFLTISLILGFFVSVPLPGRRGQESLTSYRGKRDRNKTLVILTLMVLCKRVDMFVDICSLPF
jgi:hypothetical protein